MKILLTSNFGNAMKTQSQDTITVFVDAISKLEDMVKPQILLMDTITDLSSPDDEKKLYAYHIVNNDYVVFTFTPKNHMLLIDYITLNGGNITSVTYPEKSTPKNP